MFRDLPSYAENRTSGYWGVDVPEHWREAPGLAVLKENRRKNDGLIEDQVLSLSYGKVVVKPAEKQRGLVPESYEGYQILDPGDIVVRPTDLQNDQTSIRIGHVRDRGIITSAYIGLRPTGEWTDDYAFQYLTVIDSSKRIYGMGSGLRQQLGWADLKRMPCLVPPAKEQAAIVKYLAHANARIDNAIAAKRRLIALLEEQKRTHIFEAFAARPLAETKRLRSFTGRPVGGSTPPTAEQRYFDRPDVEWHGPSSFGGGIELLPSTRRISDLAISDSVVPLIAPPALAVVVIGATCGKSALVKSPLATNQQVVSFPFSGPRCVPEFLAYQAKSFERQWRNSASTATMPILGVEVIRSTRFWLPDPATQWLVAEEITAILRKADSSIQATQWEISLLQEFRARLVADVVTGQMDVRAVAASLPDAPPAATVTGDVPAELDDLLENGDE